MASKVVGNLIVNLAANVADFRSDMKRAATTAERRMEQIERAQKKQARVAEQAMKRQDDARQRLQDGLKNLAFTFGATFAAIGASKLVGLTDQYNLLSNRLQLVTKDSKELARVQQSLFNIAQDTRQSLFSTTELFVRLAQNSEAVGGSTAQILRFTETLQKLVIISGASATESKAAIIQLAQGMASGQLRGEELRSVMEQLPAVAKKLAEQLTGGNIGAFRDMAHAGQVSANDVLTAILNVSAETDRSFNSMSMTVGQAWQQLKNEFIRGTAAMNNAVGINSGLAEGISLIAENLGNLAKALGVVVVVITARLLSSLTASAAAWAANTQQVIAYQAALARMAGVSRTAAAGIGVLTGATRVLKGAMALVGGPAGAIFLGVAALSAWATASDRAKVKTAELSRKVKDMAENFDSLTRAQQENAVIQQSRVVAGIQSQLEAKQKELNNLLVPRTFTTPMGNITIGGGSREEIVAIQAAIDTLNQKLGEEQALLQKLNDGFLLVGKTGKDSAEKTKDAFLDATAGVVKFSAEQQKILALFSQYQPAAQKIAVLKSELLDLARAGKISQETFQNGIAALNQRLEDLKGKAPEAFDFMAAAAEGAAQSMQSHLADFFMNFDGGIKGMLKGFLEAMQRMTAEMLAFQLLKNTIGQIPGFSAAFAPAHAAIGGLASGPTIVGEHGPELINLPAMTRVTPNSKLGGINVTVNQDNRNAMSPAQIMEFGERLRGQILNDVIRMQNGYAPA